MRETKTKTTFDHLKEALIRFAVREVQQLKEQLDEYAGMNDGTWEAVGTKLRELVTRREGLKQADSIGALLSAWTGQQHPVRMTTAEVLQLVEIALGRSPGPVISDIFTELFGR